MTDAETQGAELLREAAKLMRKRAEAATPGPWKAEEDGDQFSVLECRPEFNKGGRFSQVATCNGWNDDEDADEPNAEHIASWHPAVALAVADWLDTVAERLTSDKLGPPTAPSGAFAVARTYLGRDT